MDLQAWMAARDLKDDEVAQSANVVRSTISKIRRKKQRPEPELAAFLVAWSEREPAPDGGVITWPELYGLPAPTDAPGDVPAAQQAEEAA